MNWGERRRLPPRRVGIRLSARVGGHTVHLGTGEYPNGMLGEIFVDVHKEGAPFRALLNAFARLVSLALQHGVPLSTIVHHFAGVRFEPAGLVEDHEPSNGAVITEATSILDFIVRALAAEYIDEGGASS